VKFAKIRVNCSHNHIYNFSALLPLYMSNLFSLSQTSLFIKKIMIKIILYFYSFLSLFSLYIQTEIICEKGTYVGKRGAGCHSYYLAI